MPQQIARRLCRAARALAGWNQADLARAANVSKQTIVDFERGARTPFPNNLRAIGAALASVGVEFTIDANGRPGLRVGRPAPGAVEGGEAPPKAPPMSLEALYRRAGAPAPRPSGRGPRRRP